MAGNGMEVDPPPVSAALTQSPGHGLLKRSNSAPMINVLTSCSSNEASPNSSIDSQASPAGSTASGPTASSTPSSVHQTHKERYIITNTLQ